MIVAKHTNTVNELLFTEEQQTVQIPKMYVWAAYPLGVYNRKNGTIEY
jgi:hypothetical protein